MRFHSLIDQLPTEVPFVPVEALERQHGVTIHTRLGANESTFGISPRAKKTMIEAIDDVYCYGDSECYVLREALGRHWGVSMDRISVGSGIDELLGSIMRAIVAPGECMVASTGGYPTFVFHAKGYQAQLVTAPYREFRNDLEALGRLAVEHQARLVYVVNPDNPTGTLLPKEDILSLLAQLPSDCFLLIDEAYIEFAPTDQVIPLKVDDPRLIRTRTFSKVYGMAGARVGYVIASRELVQALDKIRNHFGVNRISQIGAVAALNDPDFVQQIQREVSIGREAYYQLASELGFETYPSYTNFVAMHVGSSQRALAIKDQLLQRGIFIRTPQVEPLSACLRVSVGRAHERAVLAEALKEIVIAGV